MGDAEFGSGYVGVLEGERGGWGVGLRNKEGVGKLFHCAYCGVFGENKRTSVLRVKHEYGEAKVHISEILI